MPDEPEVHGLAALMLVNDARRDARFAHGALVLLRDQDRSLWDEGKITLGRAALERALALGGRGPYVLQAAIASLHLDDPADWTEIATWSGAQSCGADPGECQARVTATRASNPNRPKGR